MPPRTYLFVYSNFTSSQSSGRCHHRTPLGQAQPWRPHPSECLSGRAPFFYSLLTTRYSLARRLNRPAVQPPQTTVQPLFSTVPCKLLNILANLMVKSFMFASHPTYPSIRPRPLHSLASNNCHPACPERSRRERSEGSAFLPLVAHRHSPLVYPEPLTAILLLREEPRGDAASQSAENPATLSPFSATLTRRVKPNPFVCHSYKKHLGVGVPRQILPISYSSIFSADSAISAPSALNSLSPICIASTIANSSRIRTYAKHTRNPFRIRTSKTQHLKPFRMNTYRKTGEGGTSAKWDRLQSVLFHFKGWLVCRKEIRSPESEQKQQFTTGGVRGRPEQPQFPAAAVHPRNICGTARSTLRYLRESLFSAR
jgi:hypothetical protein